MTCLCRSGEFLCLECQETLRLEFQRRHLAGELETCTPERRRKVRDNLRGCRPAKPHSASRKRPRQRHEAKTSPAARNPVFRSAATVAVENASATVTMPLTTSGSGLVAGGLAD
jgi:hypothetical protein